VNHYRNIFAQNLKVVDDLYEIVHFLLTISIEWIEAKFYQHRGVIHGEDEQIQRSRASDCPHNSLNMFGKRKICGSDCGRRLWCSW
jgi:hypothetical protein